MAFYDTTWYVHAGDGSTTGYYAVPVWTASTSTPPGTLRRQTAPAVGSERVFVAVQISTANTGTTEPTWVLTRGGRTTDSGVTWEECTGAAAVNGDAANTPTWSQARAISTTVTQGAIIKRNSGNSFWIATSASGTMGASEPAFVDTLGSSIGDNTVVWLCIILASAMPSPWAAPHARLANAFVSTWGVNGNDFYVADNSAETSSAAITLQTGTTSFPSRIFSIDHTVSLPAGATGLKPGASFNSSVAAGNAVFVGSANQTSSYWYGFTFIGSANFAGNLVQVAGASFASMQFDTCSFRLSGGNAGSTMLFGLGTVALDFINCSIGFTNAGQVAQFASAPATWRGSTAPFLSGLVGGVTYVLPTIAMRGYLSDGINVLFEGIDFSVLGTGTLVSVAQGGGAFTFKNCKMNTGNVMSGIAASGEAALTVDVVNSDSGGKVYRNERYSMYGTLATSIGVARNGGATDGSTPVSHNITPNTSFSKPYRPFNCIPLVIWNDVVGMGRSLTVYGMMPGSTNQPLPYNDQFWIDVEYMGDASTPNAALVSTGLPTQLTPHSQIAAADGSSWGSTVGTTFSLTATFTAQQKGYVTVYPRSAGSLAFYLDPKPVLGSSIWSAADAALFTGTVISNNGLTFATPTGAPNSGLAALRSTISHTTGKYYVEALCTTSLASNGVSWGLASASADMTTNVGTTNYSVTWPLYVGGELVSSGFTAIDGSLPGYTPVANDVLQIAVDLTAGNIWWGLNNVWYGSGNPAAGTGAMVTIGSPVLGSIPLFPALGVYVPGPSGPWTLQAVPANQKYAPPAGFTAWG